MQTKMTRAALERELKAAANAERAVGMARFFKTGPGQYGEGDVFLGIATPVMRKIALRYRTLEFEDLQRMLESKLHEHRSVAVEILVAQYKKGDEALRGEIVAFYLGNTHRINNWDLVDASAPYILGEHLKTRSRKMLVKLARSKSLWERRIAIVSTLRLVRAGELDDALQIAEMLLDDTHDLMHKAVGWVLREVGDKDESALVDFLKTHYERLPRTALRYAIEHFSPEVRKKMLRGEF
jgi:3-methyladenine DNA glycosylase AlkD